MTLPSHLQGGLPVTQIICGVDISSSSFDPRGPRPELRRLPQHRRRHRLALADFCRSHTVGLVAMEATGGYDGSPSPCLSEQGLGVAILAHARCAASPKAWVCWRRLTGWTPV